MIRLADISGYGLVPCIDLEGKGLINILLTPEILDEVFNKLRSLDFLSANRVCRFWHERTVSVAKNNCVLIKNFTDLYIKPLTIENKKIISNVTASADCLYDFTQMQAPILNYLLHRNSFKESFFDLLQVTEVECSSHPSLSFLKSAFDLTKIYKELDQLKEDQDKGPLAYRLAKALIDLDDKPYVYKNTNTVSRTLYKREIRKSYTEGILFFLISSMKLDDRIEIGKMIEEARKP